MTLNVVLLNTIIPLKNNLSIEKCVNSVLNKVVDKYSITVIIINEPVFMSGEQH